MGLFTGFGAGFRSYGQAHSFIVKHRMWPYLLLPAAINLVMIALLLFGGWALIGQFTNWFFDITGLSGSSEGVLGFLVSAFKWLIRALLHVLLFFFYASVYRYIVLIVLSPALALLSEKTEKLLTGADYPFNFRHFLADVWRGIRIAIRNSLIEFGWVILMFFAGFVPVVGFMAPVVLFFVSCYFYGFSMIDYSNERSRMKMKESVKFVRKNMGMAIANGMVFFFVFFFIPIIGFMIAPAYAVVAATLATHQKRNPQILP